MVTTATRPLSARTATMPIIRMPARLMATTDLIGSMAASLLALGRGSMAFAGATGADQDSADVADSDLTDEAEHLGAGLLHADLGSLDVAELPAVELSREVLLAAVSEDALAVDSPAVEAVASMVVVDFTVVADRTAVAAMVAGTGN